MPPKRKGSSKKPEKDRTPILIDGFPKEELSKEQVRDYVFDCVERCLKENGKMEEHILRLLEELDREKEERNYFQLKRDKSHKYCEITDNELEELRAEKKKIDKDIEEEERCYQVELKVCKQKLKHALHEHQNTISKLKAEAVDSTQLVQEEQNKLETELHKDTRAVMVDMQEELDYENRVKELELKHNEDVTKLRNVTEKQIAEIQVKGEERMELLQQKLDKQREEVVRGVEDQWNSHMNSLTEDHEQAFSEIDALMLDMNPVMDINKTLMAKWEEAKTEKEEMEKDLVGLFQENKHLTGFLLDVKEEITAIERKIKYVPLKKDVSEQVAEKKLDQQKGQYETLEHTFCKLQLERDELEKTSAQIIQQVQDKAARKSALLKMELAGLTDGLEKTHAQLLAMLSASDVDRTALDEIDRYLDFSHYSIEHLEYKIAKLTQARKDLLYFYEAKQRALGVPLEEL